MFSSMGSEIVPASAIDRLQRSGAEYCKAIASLLAMTDTHDKSRVIFGTKHGLQLPQSTTTSTVHHPRLSTNAKKPVFRKL
ncbi:hypothetical protein PC123_g28004 [Phytophthora cactorum]|nr:hypothetical protein PC120_g27694 [Phytophthora cactorum]KAG4036426.1 hypothetical protein PC123_g28004 [Phytophthora cactorum]